MILRCFQRLLLMWAALFFQDRDMHAAEGSDYRVMVFSKTAGFRHKSIPDGIAAIEKLGKENGFTVDASEDAAIFSDDDLGRYAAVVFLSTTGDILTADQQAAFERYIGKGGGFAGVHAASDTEFDWPWFGGLVGAWFKNHPPGTSRATIEIEDAAHPSMRGLPKSWPRTDEWYNFRENPRGKVDVLAVLDESTYEGGGMGEDHPIVWAHEYAGGRAWYTALGHTKESFQEPLFLQHLLGGIEWAAGRSAKKEAPDTAP